MPVDFGQILGGVLVGVAEARSLGDRYSRGLALLYEKDDLLRAFPVPRAEMASVEVTLSFALAAADAVPPPEVRALVERSRAASVSVLAGALRQAKVRRSATDLDATAGAAVGQEIERATLLAAAMPAGPGIESFDVDRVTRAILAALKGVKAARPDGPLAEKLRAALGAVRDAHAAGVADLRGQGLFAGRSLSVLATHNEIAGLPAAAVSSVKMTINLRNYEWTQTDVRDGEPVRKLVRE